MKVIETTKETKMRKNIQMQREKPREKLSRSNGGCDAGD